MIVVGSRNFFGIVMLTVISALLGACGPINKSVQIIEEAAMKHSPFVSTELAYAGFELHWQLEKEAPDTDEFAEFRSDFSKTFGAGMDRRAPLYLKGDRPVRIIVIVSDVDRPKGLAKTLDLKNPSIQIKSIVQDVSNEQILFTRESTIVDWVSNPSGGITFRFGKVAHGLADNVVQVLMNWLRSL